MSFSSQFRGYFKNWLYGKAKQPAAYRLQATRLAVELLEDRTLLSALPAAVVGNAALNFESLVPAFPWGGPSIRTQATSPQVIVDPLDPNKIVEVHAVFLSSDVIPATHITIYNNVPEGVNAPQWVLEGSYSGDQGRTWTFFSVGQAISDPADIGLNNVPFDSIEDVSASFDRNHHFYVVSLQHNNPGAAPDARETHISGAIVMQRFDYSGNAPVQDLSLGQAGTGGLGLGGGIVGGVGGLIGFGSGTFTPAQTDSFSPGNSVIYRWYDQDPASNPVVAIDNNLPTFTDPVTGALQTDSMATMVSIPAVSNANVSYPADLVPKAVYVAYNVVQTFPQPPIGDPPLPLESRVFMAASADGGRQFTNQELVSDLLHFRADFIAKDEPAQVPILQTGTEAANPQIVFTQGAAQRPSFFVYNGQKSQTFFFDIATATASQIQSILDTIPGLTGDTAVTYIGGGSTTKNVAGSTFNITFLNGATPYFLTYDGPGTLATTSSTVAAFTGISGTVGGQVMVFYNDIFNGFDRIYYDSSRPDAGDPATPVAAASIFTSGEVGITIADGIAAANGAPNRAGITDVPVNVDFSTTGINGINLDQVTDLTVTVNLIDDTHMDELAIILIPPPGLPQVNLLLNRIGLDGKTVTPDGVHPQGLPAVANGALGEIPVPTPTITYEPVGTVFDDNAPRYLTDGVDGFFPETAFNPYIGHFQPEEDNPNFAGFPGFLGSLGAPYVGLGALQALIASPNFMTLAKGTWTLRMLDFRASPTPPPFIQIIDSWSLNFTGRIATTKGAFAPGTPFPDYAGFPGGTIQGVTFPEQAFPGGTGGFGVDVPISTPFPLPIPPDTPGAPNDAITTIPGAPQDVYPNNPTVAPVGTPGIGPTISVAVDNTLGSFSPFQGRVYVAYTAANGADTNINLISSDFPQGATDTSITPSTLEGAASSTDHWTIDPALGQVNDDAPGDNFTEGNRTQFNPTITVDPVTGTLGLMWYDGRYDAAHARVANAFTTSIDGGVTFAPDTFLNTKQTATDFYTGATILQEPIPDNMALASAFGFSDRSGLAMYGGRVYPAWSGNLDIPQGNITVNGINGTPGSMIFTNTVTVAGGPRLLTGSMGPIVNDFNSGNTNYNNTFTTDNTRQLNGFVLTFDRPVDPATLTPGMITVTYRDPNTPAGSPGTDISNQITGITPLDLSAAHGPNASGTPPSFSVSDTIVQEPFASRTSASFTVILSQAVGTPVSVDWSTQDDTGSTAATSTGANADYVPSHGTLVFNPGQVTASFQVPVLKDSLFTSNRHFLVNLSNAPAAIVINRTQGKATIISDQNVPALTVGNAYVQKNSSGSFTYNGQSSTSITLTPATTAAQILATLNSITALNGNVVVSGNTGGPFTLTFTNGTTASQLGFVNAGEITVTSATTATLSINPVISFPVFLNAPATTDISVDFSFSDGTAKSGVDYLGVPGTLTILKGNTTGVITATVISNQLSSGNLNFFLNLTNPVNGSITQTQATGVIVDDNALAVSVGDVTVQRSATPQTANVTFYLNGISSQDVTIHYRTVAGTAIDGTDYTGTQTGTIVIPKGSQSVTVPISILGSTTAANNKNFQVQITSVTSASIAASNASANVTIVDDNEVPAVFVADAIVRQNLTTASTTVDVPIYLTFVSPTDIKLNIQTIAAGTNQAIAGKDYIAIPPTDIIIPAGQSKGDVIVTLPTDIRAQLPINPTFGVIVNSVGSGNATLARPEGIVTIVSDTVQVSVGDVTVQENPNGIQTARFQVFLSGPSELPISVTVATGGANDTAVAGTDYQASTQTVTFAPGQIVAPVNVTVLHNLTANGSPVAFSLNVTGIKIGTLTATDPNLIAPGYGTGTGTIVDVDGTAGPFITIGDVTGDVGSAFGPVTFSFPVFSDPPIGALTVTVTAAGPGIVPIAAVVTTLPNATGQFVVDVTVNPNNPFGFTQPFIGNRQFTVTLTAPTVGSLSTKASGTGKIIDDNATTINIGNVASFPGRDPNKNTEFDFPVVVSNMAASFVPSATIAGNYSTADGTATAAESDYIPVFSNPNNLQFFKTSDKFPLPVLVPGTTTPEGAPDYETFTATLSNTVNVSVPYGVYPPNANATGTAYIIDPNLLNLSVSDTSVQETPTGASMDFVVYLNGISGQDVSFTWTLTDGTAKAGIDYGAPISATDKIPAGSLFKRISIPINAETAYKGNRFFTMNLSKPTNAGIQKGTGTGTIMDNELTPTLTISDAIVKKGPSGQQQATFTVFANYPAATAATPTGVPTTVTVLLSDGTATSAEGDYVNTPITVTLPAGATSATFNVPINGDTHAEGNETFKATLSNPSNGDLIAPRVATPDLGVVGEGIATIVDYNSVTALNVGDVIITKGFSGQQIVNVPVVLSTPSPVPITVQVDTTDGTATVAHHDYVPIVGQIITIPANTTTFTIPVTILGNSNPTGDLGFFITLSNPQNATVLKSKGSVTIVDPNSVMGATQFLVSLKPQGAVGTYSYAVQPLVSDRIRLPFGQGGANLTISDVTVQDNATEADFTLLLSQSNPQTVTVQVSTADGTAIAGKDYLPLASQLVTFSPGSTTAIVRVPLVNIGSTIEPLRTFTLSARNLALSGSVLPASSILDVGTASIVDRNDQSQTFWNIGDGISRAGAGSSVNVNIFTNGSFATWTPQGPVPDIVGRLNSAGAVESIAVDPNNPAHIVLGAVNGGIWQTFNADPNNPSAVTWAPIGDNLKSLSIGDVVFDATDTTGKTFYAGTGLWTNNFNTGGSSVGLYKTTDGGQTWTLLGQNTLTGHRIRAIDVSGQTILVGTVNGTGTNADPSRDYTALGGGLFRSTDGGATFVPVVGATGSTLPAGPVVSVVNDPNVAGRVYVAVGGQGIFRSDNALGNSPDGSVIWTPVNTGLTGLATSVDVEMVSQSIAGATTLYAGVAANDGSLAIYTSTDGGNQWTPLAALPTSFDDGISGFAEKFNMVADPTTAGVVYLDGESGSIQGSPGILRYNPAGSGSWVEIDGSGTATGTAPHPDSRDMQFLGNNTLLESDDGGIYVLPSPANSTGNDWSSLNGNINDVELFSVSYDSTNNILFGGSQDNGSPVQSSPGNLLWKDLSSGDGQYTAVDTTSRPNGDVLRYVLSNNWSNLLRLEYDNANNLVSSTTVGLRAFPGAFNGSGLNNADLNFYFSGNFDFQPYVLNAVDPRLMLLGFFGVYEDADPSPANGDAGDVITDITAKVGNTNFVTSLAYGGFRAGTGYTNVAMVGTLSGQLFYRGETGSTFTEVDGTGAGKLGGTGAIQSIAVDPSDWRAVYVVRGTQLWYTPNITNLAANPFRVIGNGPSDNLGQITTELTTVNVVRIGNTSVPLVGAQGGVYRMLSPGSWSLYGQGLPNVVVHSIVYNPAQDVIVAGTFGRGAWTINNASATLLSTAPLQSSTAQTILVTSNDPSGQTVPLTNFPVTLPANSSSVIVSIPLKPGVTPTSNLTFTVSIASPSSGVLGQKTTGTAIFVAPTTFDTTRLSATPINWQSVVPQTITQGNATTAQQNIPINAATLPIPAQGKPSVPYVATSTINISGISAAQVLRDLTVTVNAEFPDTTGLLVQLIAPNNGPTYTLSQNEPGSNFPNTVFDDQALNPISKRTASSVQTVTVDATGGTFTLAFEGSLVTPALPWNASAAAVQLDIETMLSVQPGSVVVTLEASKNPNAARVYTVTFTGLNNPPLLIANGNPLTGNSHSATVASLLPQGALSSFRPETPLSAVPLAANQLNGTWTLKITNSSTSNFGTLSNWSLRLQTGVFADALTPNDPGYSGSLGNAMDQLQQGFTASLTRDPTSIFAVPYPAGGVPLAVTAPFLSPPYDPATLPLIIPGPHQDVIKYTTSDIAQTLTFGPGIAGGTFTLTYNGQRTTPITWSASTSILQHNIQSALDALTTIGQSNTTVSNAANPVITFVNALSGSNAGTLTFDGGGLSGGTITGITRIAVGTPANPLNLAIPQAINDPHTNVVTPGVLNVPIVVANAPVERVLTGLTVRIDVQHPFAADLRLSLVAPDGTTVLLANQVGAGGPNFDGTTFDDNAATAITAGTTPFQGTYAPVQPLSTFYGKNINGTWTLKVEDMKADGQHGQVLYWQLIPTSGLILNQTNTYADVVFDREINTSTIDATNVSNMLGPIGQVAGPFTITANPTVPGTSVPVYPAEFTNRVFRISFPAQQYSGSYSLVVGPVNNTVNPLLNKTIKDLAGNAIDNNLNAGLDVARGVNPVDAGTTTKTYSSPILNQAFSPGGAAFSTITVPDDYIITQDDLNHIQLQLAVMHQNTPDLIGTLTAPDGTVVTLFTHVGVNGAVAGNPHPDLGNNTTFDDFAVNVIQNASVGLAGTYKPQTPLSLLVGKNAKGTWELTIFNEAKNPVNLYSIGTFPGTLVQWSLTFPSTVPGTGLGQTGADQINTGFRIFTTSPSNSLSSSVWTAIGPAPETGGQTGPVGAITVDPADSTGNTVYAAGASGGVWKTYNFMTTDPKGPNWIPLTDLGPLNSLNIGTLTAVASPDGDPNKTTILAGTGTATTTSSTSNGLPITNAGVGFLRSTDGGRTWQVIDSSNNNVSTNPVTQVQTALPISSTLRNHLFDGTAINKIVVDPAPLNGKFVVYAAIAGTSAANSGLFRSLDSGVTWTQVEAGICTDVVLAGGSGSGGSGQMQVLYAGFMTGFGRTGGVYFTSSAVGTPLNTLLPVPNDGTGAPGPNQGVNSRVNIDPEAPPFPTTTITVGNPTNNPSGTNSPIVLATPAKTNQPLKDALYQGWVYAYTNNTLYETKDFGQNWTQVNLPITSLNPLAVNGNKPTNDTTKPNFTLGVVKSIVIDPSNPNIIYVGGTNPIGFHGLGQNLNNGTASSVVRVDLTNISDVYSFVNNDYSDPTGTIAKDPGVGDATGTGPGAVFHDFGGSPSSDVLTMLRDPANPFLAPSSLQFTNTLNFRNDGSDVHWQFFDFGQGNVNQMVSITDPLTGNIRLFSATSTGVYTGVDIGEGNIDPGIGSAASVSGSRVGNLQIGQITDTGVQPSTLAGAISGALLYAENPGVGTPMSDPNIFQDGNLTWRNLSSGYGEAIVADPSGSGTVFRYQYPYTADYPLYPTTAFSPLNGNDFFEVNPPGTVPGPTDQNADGTASAGTGLIQAGDFPSTTGAGQWPGFVNQGSNFAVNSLENTDSSGTPINYPGLVMSSRAGRIFRASNISLAAGVGGIVWQDIGDPNVLDGTYAPAVAFGSPTQVAGRNVDDFIYVGTLKGNVFMTTTGGGTNWLKISGANGLDGSPVLSISADPTRGSHKVFALTQQALYYCADSSAANPVWVRLNDTANKTYIFPNATTTPNQTGIQRPVWNNPLDLVPAFNAATGLTSLAVDWRFALPDATGTGTHPVLYVGGDGGVVTSTDLGSTWSIFSNLSASNSATQTGGYLPSVRVTDLKLILGNTNPVTGVPDTSTGLNMLVASTYGRGDFAIRLNTSGYAGDVVIPNSGPQVASVAPSTGTFGEFLTGITVTFKGAVDPTSFSPADVTSVIGPNGAVPVQYVFDTTPTGGPGTGNLHNVYTIQFLTPQTKNGTYTVVLGPNITDFSGNLMNQNGNSVNGEASDQFQGSISFVANTPPTISNIPTQQSSPGVPITINFTIADATDATATLTLTPPPTSSNTDLVPNGNIVIGTVAGTNGAGHTLTITPTSNQPGATLITVSVTDPRGLSTSESFELIFGIPVVLPANPGPQTIPHGHTLTLPFNVTGSSALALTVSAVATSPIYNLWTKLQFAQVNGTYYQNSSGRNEKWVFSNVNNSWYIIQPTGLLSIWNGGKSFSPVPTDQFGNPLLLDNSFWVDPTKLTAPPAPITFTGSIQGANPNMTLQLTPPINFVGSATVTVSANDGLATSSLSFPLTVTNAAPTFNPIGTPTIPGGIPALSVSPSLPSLVLQMAGPAPAGFGLADADDGVSGVSLSGSKAYADNAAGIAYEVSQTYALYYTGNYYFNSSGLGEKWVQSRTTGDWYIIQSSGAFSHWNGGSSFTQLKTLDNSYWQDPTKLVTAAEPTPLAGATTIDDANHIVTVVPMAQTEIVKVAATDGVATTTQFFDLNVAAVPPAFSVPDQQLAHNVTGNPQLQIDLTNQPANSAGDLLNPDANGLPVTTTLAVYNFVPGEAYKLSTSLDLQLHTSTYQDTEGRGERWLFGQATKTWYIIEPNGNFSQWNGGTSFTLVAKLDHSYWNNINSLININDGNHVVAPTPLVSTPAFSFADNANVLTFNTDGTVAGNYLASVTAVDSLSSATKTFEISLTDVAPSFSVSTPGSTNISHTASYDATISPVSDGDAAIGGVAETPTMSANVFAFVPGFAYELQQTYGFYSTGNYYSSGTAPKWIRSAANNLWYTIDKTGLISQWNGGTSFTPIGTLDASYYADPNKLFNSVTAPASLTPAAITAVFSGSNAAGYDLHLQPINAAGNLLVQVNAVDSAATTSKYFALTVTSPTPTFTVTPQTPSVAFTNVATAAVNNISAAPDPISSVTFTASVYPLISGLAYQLNQAKGFSFNGSYSLNYAGLGEKWIFSNVESAWYTIEPTGKLSKWNGGTSFTQVVLNGVPVVLGPDYWTDPSKLYNANTPPADLAKVGTFTTSFTGTNSTGLILTVNPNGQNAGDYLIGVNGNDAGAVNTQYFAQNFSDFAPTFGQPADQSIAHGVATYTLDLTNPASFAHPSAIPSPVLTYAEGIPPGSLSTVTVGVKTYYATSAGIAYQLNSQFNLFTTGNYFQNALGLGERWVRSHVNNQWYIIEPSGKFSVWNGGSSVTFIAQLDSSYYADPTKLFNAAEPASADTTAPPQNPAAGASSPLTTPAVLSYGIDNVGHKVTVNTDPNFVGTLLVKVTAKDPAGLATSQFFKLTTTSLTPTLSIVPPGPLALSKAGTPLTVELVGNDPDSGNSKPLNYVVTVTDVSAAAQAFALQQAQNLFVDGSLFVNYYGQQEIWLRSHATGAWYGITPDGAVHLLDTAHLLGPVVANLGTAYYNNYTLLLNATNPGSLALTKQVSAAFDPSNPDAMNLTLAWTNPSFPSSGNYPILVSVTVTNSVGASTTQTFVLNVS